MSFQYQVLSFLTVTYNTNFCIGNENNFIPCKVIPQLSADLERRKGLTLVEFLLYVRVFLILPAPLWFCKANEGKR